MAVEEIRQACAEAAGYVYQAVGEQDSIASSLAHASDGANAVGERVSAAIEAINAEIALLQST